MKPIDIAPQAFVYHPSGLSLDLWRPEQPPRGLIIHAHGGSFIHGSRNDRIARKYGPSMAARGIAFASIDYRRGGTPMAQLPPDLQEHVTRAQKLSSTIFPNINPKLLGPHLYRATLDFEMAIVFLRETRADLGLSEAPLIAMGLSAGGLAAIGCGHPPEGMNRLPTHLQPTRILGMATVPPQPWRLLRDGPHISILHARGDAVIPRGGIAHVARIAQEEKLPFENLMIPFGQHNRPVRELMHDPHPDSAPWQRWLDDQVNEVCGTA